jgi:hypothetical protein
MLGAVAVSCCNAVIHHVIMTWRALGRRQASFRICAVIDPTTRRPCVLADGHGNRQGNEEHASAWVEDDDDSRRETRHRWDGHDPLGREEQRWKPEYLPKFTADGERAR